MAARGRRRFAPGTADGWKVVGDGISTHYGGVSPGTAPVATPAVPRLPARGTRAGAARVTKFLVPDVVFGIGVLSEVGQAVKRQGGAHVFVVSDPGVVSAGWTGEALKHLEAVGVACELWVGMTPNPKDREVESGWFLAYPSGSRRTADVHAGLLLVLARSGWPNLA